jgi:hypothetical protein
MVMSETIPKIEMTSSLVKGISQASIEQNNGVSQVNNALQQLNNVTQQNSSSSEELAASSEQLSVLSENLNEILKYFKITKNQVLPRKEEFFVKEIKLPEKNESNKYIPVSKGIKLDLEEDSGHDNEFEKF